MTQIHAKRIVPHDGAGDTVKPSAQLVKQPTDSTTEKDEPRGPIQSNRVHPQVADGTQTHNAAVSDDDNGGEEEVRPVVLAVADLTDHDPVKANQYTPTPFVKEGQGIDMTQLRQGHVIGEGPPAAVATPQGRMAAARSASVQIIGNIIQRLTSPVTGNKAKVGIDMSEGEVTESPNIELTVNDSRHNTVPTTDSAQHADMSFTQEVGAPGVVTQEVVNAPPDEDVSRPFEKQMAALPPPEERRDDRIDPNGSHTPMQEEEKDMDKSEGSTHVNVPHEPSPVSASSPAPALTSFATVVTASLAHPSHGSPNSGSVPPRQPPRSQDYRSMKSDFNVAQVEKELEGEEKRMRAAVKLAVRLLKRGRAGQEEVKADERTGGVEVEVTSMADLDALKTKKLQQHKLQHARVQQSILVAKDKASGALQRRLDEMIARKKEKAVGVESSSSGTGNEGGGRGEEGPARVDSIIEEDEDDDDDDEEEDWLQIAAAKLLS